jgi:hypothetical protein
MTDSRNALVFGLDRSSVRAVEVWLRRPRAGWPGISAQRKRALAAADGGMWGWLQQQRPTTAGVPCHAPQLRISAKRFAPPVGSGVRLRAAIGEHGCDGNHGGGGSLTWRSAGEHPEGRAGAAWTHRPNGATTAINPGRSRSPLNAVSGWKLGLRITDFARFINSEIALLCGRQGAAAHGDVLVGSGGTQGRSRDHAKKGSSAQALGAKRVAVEPLDPSPGDRRVGAGVPPRADRRTTRRRGRRPRAWGEARGPRTTQPRPLRSEKRAAA